MMTKFDYNGATFRIRFEYVYAGDHPIETTAYIEELSLRLETWLVVGCERATCHPNDVFDRRVGRKLALTRALNSMQSHKSFRKAVWQAYLNNHKVK